MANTIDERVVQMKFDNAQFESGVSTTLNTLDKLKSATEFKSGSSGLNSLGAAAETVQKKFSALGTMSDQFFRNMENRLESLGRKLISSVTTEPVDAGFKEYELKMGSIQTIMMGTGESLETVNKYLDELNTYSDKTIYSFKDMTSNIGKFTNQGVKLDVAVKAMQGIANEAALSGANANEASRAMYNFSQALSAGYVKLIDWKSIENANMATVEFKDILLQTAEALGTVTKEGDEYVTTTTDLNGKVSEAFNATKNFNDSLSHQWMTNDVLTTALAAYSTNVNELTAAEKEAYEEGLRQQGFTEEQIANFEALGIKAFKAATEIKTFSMLIDTLGEAMGSGWAKTFEIIIGDFEEAKEVWTAAGDVLGTFIENISDARNNLLQSWSDLGGRTALLNSVANLFADLLSVLLPIKEAFQEIFPPTTGAQLAKITKAIESFTEKLYLSKDAAGPLKNTFKGLFAILDIGLQAIKAVISAISPAAGLIFPIVNAIFEFTGKIGEAIVALDEFIKENDVFTNGIKDIANFIQPALDALKEFGEIVSGVVVEAFEAIQAVLPDLKGDMLEVFNSDIPLLDKLVKLKDLVVNTIGPALENVFNGIDPDKLSNPLVMAFGAIPYALSQIGAAVTKNLGPLGKSIENLITLVKIFGDAIVGTLGESLPGIKDELVEIFNMDIPLTEKIQKAFESIKSLGPKLGETFSNLFSLIDFSGSGATAAWKQGLIKTFSDGSVDVGGSIKAAVQNVFNAVTGLITSGIRGIGDLIGSAGSYIVNNIDTIVSSVINAVVGLGEMVFSSAGEIIETIKDVIGDGIDGIIKGFTNLSNVKIDMPVTASAIGALGDKFNIVTPIIETAGNAMEKVKTTFDSVGQTLKAVGDKIAAFAQNVKEKFVQVIEFINGTDFVGIFSVLQAGLKVVNLLLTGKILGNVGKLTLSIKALFDVLTKKSTSNVGLADFITNIVSIPKNLADSITKVGDAIVNTFKTIQADIKSNIIKKIAVSIAILAAACWVLSKIPAEDLKAAGIALAGLAGGLTGAVSIIALVDKFAKIDTAKLSQIATAMIPMAAALLILCVALKKLEGFKFEEDWESLVALGAIMAGSVGSMIALSKYANDVGKSAAALLILAGSIYIIAAAFEKLSTISANGGNLEQGAGAFTLIVVALSSMMKVLQDCDKITVTSGAGFLLLALSLKKIVQVVEAFGKIPTAELEQGMVAFGLALAAITTAFKVLSNSTADMAAVGAGMLAAAVAMNLIAAAIAILGIIPSAQLEQGMVALGLSLATVVVAFGALDKLKGNMTEIGVGLLAASAGILALAVGMKILSTIPLAAMGVALLGLVVSLGALVAAAVLVAPFTAALTAVGVGLLAVAAACLVFGIGLVAVGAGLTMIAAAGAAAGLGIAAFLTSIITMIPLIVGQISLIITEITMALQLLIPQIISAVLNIITSVVQVLSQKVPLLVQTVMQFLTAILQTIAANLPQLIVAGTQVVIAFIQGIASSIAAVIQAAVDLAISFINGLAEGIRNNTDAMIAAVDNLMDAVIESLGKWLEHFLTKGGELIGKLGEGIQEHGPDILAKVGELVQEAAGHIGDFIEDFASAGANLVAGFIEGLGRNISGIASAAVNIGSNAISALKEKLGINSPSKVAAELGMYTVQGYTSGVEKHAKEASDVSGTMAEDAIEAMRVGFGTHSKSKKTTQMANDVADGYTETLNDRVDGAAAQSEKFATKSMQAIGGVVRNSAKAWGKLLDERGEELGLVGNDAVETVNKVTSSVKENTEATDKATESTSKNTKATSSNTKSTSSNTKATTSNTSAKTSQAKATEEATEKMEVEQKVLDKYAKYSVASIEATKAALDGMFGSTEDAASRLGLAQQSITTLAEQIYAAKLASEETESSTSDSTEDSVNHVQKILEAFNEQFETYRDNIKSSIDLFEQFDAQLDSTKKGDEVLAAANSQIEGYTHLAQKYMALAGRGVSRTVLAELEEEGTSALPKINSMLKMSDAQLEEYLADLEKIDVISNAVAGQMMAAQAISNLTTTWKKQASTQTGITTKMREDYAKYVEQVNLLNQKSVENTQMIFEEGLDETHAGVVAILDETGEAIEYKTIDIQAAIEALGTDAQEAGMDVEEMMTKLGDVTATEATAALQLVDAYTDATSTIVEYQETFTSMKQTVKETIESQLGLFDELELKTETTSEEIIKGLQSQIEGMQKWAAEYQSVANRGLSEEILSELASLGVEGYDSLHAFYTMSDSQLTQVNELYAQKLQVSEAVSTQVATSYAAAAVGGMQAYTNALNIYLGTDPTYQEALNSLSTSMQTVLTNTLSVVGQETAVTLSNAMASSIDANSTTVSTAAKNSATKAGEAANQTLEQEGNKIENTTRSAGQDATNAFGENVNSGTGSGQSYDYAAGVLQGINEMASQLYSAYYSAGAQANQGMHDGLGNGSPSWKGAQQGVWYMMGVANGVESMQDDVNTTAYDSGSMIAEALNQALLMEDELDGDFTMHPTIAPVVDLTDAQNGADQLAALLSGGYGLNLNPNLGRITTNADRFNSLAAMASGRGNMTYGDTVLNVYGSQGQDVKKLADIVIGKLNNEYARRKAAWS